jgi:hypothetical protein
MLALAKAGINPAFSKQAVMMSLLNNLTAINDQNMIRMANRRQPVRHNNRCPAFG